MSEWDVVVIGAGPAGCAAGNLLARAGVRTLIVEAEAAGRHHVGESLLPASMPVLESLGLTHAALAARLQPKFGARFVDPVRQETAPFWFGADDAPPPSWQADRSVLDPWLAEMACAAGCELKRARVVAVDEDAALPAVTLDGGSVVQGRFLIDASGQRAMVARKRRTREMLGQLGRIAIYSYFEELPPHDANDAKFVTMFVFDGGWIWFIPLADGRTSIGVVLSQRAKAALDDEGGMRAGPERASGGERLFWAAAARVGVAKRLAAARRVDGFRTVSDYAYRVTEIAGPRFAIVGDAAGFLDPIFSSGVHLALVSASEASAAVLRALGGDDQALGEYAAFYKHGYRVFEAFVDRFYNRGLIHNVFFGAHRQPAFQQALVNLLAGHVWDEANPLVQMLTRADAAAPGEPPAEAR